MTDKKWKIEILKWNGKDYKEFKTIISETLTFFEYNLRLDRVSVFEYIKEVTAWVSEIETAVRP